MSFQMEFMNIYAINFINIIYEKNSAFSIPVFVVGETTSASQNAIF